MTVTQDQTYAEAMWLIEHPHFDERPATIREFVGPGYLDIAAKVRPGIIEALEDIFGKEVSGERIAIPEEAMVTGGIGIGKTTFASIALPYMAHWVLCLRDPQDYFGLLPGSRIAFTQMSTSEKQVIEVIFADILARIKHAEWFRDNYPFDPTYTKQIRFPKDIWVLPGDSAETTFEGYNILGGILDEMDSHKVTDKKDYANDGFNTIESRIASRFTVEDAAGGEVGHRGLLICIGQMKKANGFAAKKYAQMKANPKAHVTRMTIWESLGWDRFTDPSGKRRSFWYDIKRKSILPAEAAELIDDHESIIEIPEAYRKQFETQPEKALKDLAGIPPATSDPFISLTYKVEEARDRWKVRHGEDSPVSDNPVRPVIYPWLKATNDPRKRAVHLDIATSGNGDALGLAMGHIDSLVDRDGDDKPYIVFDLLMRIKAPAGGEIMLSDVRRYLYTLVDDRGFRIKTVTMDGFQSTDTMQQLRRRRIKAEYLSVDRSTLPYEDLREAIYEDRIEFPPYMTYLTVGRDERVEIAYRELVGLHDTGKKIDHPATGSKDVADSMAGVVNTLMGDRTYRRGVRSTPGDSAEQDANSVIQSAWPNLPDLGAGLRAPVAPSIGGGAGIAVPDRLKARR